jgi:nucleotide-binding universal stress UspA family protein
VPPRCDQRRLGEWFAAAEEERFLTVRTASPRIRLGARPRREGDGQGESRSSIAVEPMVAVGRAYREILRVAADPPTDLIVMGAQGRGGLGHTLFGSTTQQVVRAATCPVLTVRGPHDG